MVCRGGGLWVGKGGVTGAKGGGHGLLRRELGVGKGEGYGCERGRVMVGEKGKGYGWGKRGRAMGGERVRIMGKVGGVGWE